jgi:hypothetical protein
MPSMEHNTAQDELFYIIEQMEFLPPEREEHLKNLVLGVWNDGYDAALANESRLKRESRSDLQDQIDDLQQLVFDLQVEVNAIRKEKQPPGGNLFNREELPIKSRFYVEFDNTTDEGGTGPHVYRDFMVVFALNKWYAENKVKIAYPNANNFETFLLSKQEA